MKRRVGKFVSWCSRGQPAKQTEYIGRLRKFEDSTYEGGKRQVSHDGKHQGPLMGEHLHQVQLEHLHQVPVLPPHLNLKEANSEGGKALVDRVVVFVLSSPVLLMFLQWLGMEPSSRENLYRSLFLNQLDYMTHVLVHLLKSFRAYIVKSSSTLFSDNIQ